MTVPTALVAYHGDKSLKTALLKELRWHRKEDMIAKGTYGEQNGHWRGCAVGCSIHSLNRIRGKNFPTDRHALYETELGIPEWLARLEDTIFEGLPDSECLDFPIQFAAAIKAGANLDRVKPLFCIFVLTDCRPNARDDGKRAIDTVIALHQRAADGEAVSAEEWSAAESAESARSAARSAAWSARSAAWSAAESAAESAESAAWSARSAAWSARSAAWSAAFVRYRDELLRLLKSCKAVLP